MARQSAEEQQRHREADADADIGGPEEAPAEAADQIDHRIEQRTVCQNGGSTLIE